MSNSNFKIQSFGATSAFDPNKISLSDFSINNSNDENIKKNKYSNFPESFLSANKSFQFDFNNMYKNPLYLNEIKYFSQITFLVSRVNLLYNYYTHIKISIIFAFRKCDNSIICKNVIGTLEPFDNCNTSGVFYIKFKFPIVDIPDNVVLTRLYYKFFSDDNTVSNDDLRNLDFYGSDVMYSPFENPSLYIADPSSGVDLKLTCDNYRELFGRDADAEYTGLIFILE